MSEDGWKQVLTEANGSLDVSEVREDFQRYGVDSYDTQRELVNTLADEGRVSSLYTGDIRTERLWNLFKGFYERKEELSDEIDEIREWAGSDHPGKLFWGASMTGKKLAEKSEINPNNIIPDLARTEYHQSGRADNLDDTTFVKSLYQNIWDIKTAHEDIGITASKSYREAHLEVWNNISEGMEDTTIDTDDMQEAKKDIEEQLMIGNPYTDRPYLR